MPTTFEIHWKEDWLLRGPVTKEYIELAKKILDLLLYFEEAPKTQTRSETVDLTPTVQRTR